MKKLFLAFLLTTAAMASDSTTLETQAPKDGFRFGLGVAYYFGGNSMPLVSTLFQLNPIHSIQGIVGASSGSVGLLAHYRVRLLPVELLGFNAGFGMGMATTRSNPVFSFYPTFGAFWRPTTNLAFFVDTGPAFAPAARTVSMVAGFSVHALL